VKKYFALPIAALAFLLAASTAQAVGPVTPLDEEPASLHEDGNQAVLSHASVPEECTVIVDSVGATSCLEKITDWLCPAGEYGLNPLSEDAKLRLSPSYEEAIANPVSPRAYLDTHCLLVGTRPLPVPSPTAECGVGQVVAASSTGELVCAVPTPAAPAVPAAPVVSFTG